MAHPAPLELSSCCEASACKRRTSKSWCPLGCDCFQIECGKSLNTVADYGSLTFVFQDDVSFTVSLIPYLNFVVQVGGLQVQNPHTQNYIPAVPIVSKMSFADAAEFIQFM